MRSVRRGNIELTQESCIVLTPDAGVAELADALDSKAKTLT